jgi:PAS domain S-box-containing protein
MHVPSPETTQQPPEPPSLASTPASDGLYRLLVDGVHDYAVFALDAGGRVLTWNPGAERFEGYRVDEIVGRHFSVFYPPEDVAAGKPQRELQTAAAHGRYEEEGWRVRKDGTRFWASVVITPLRDGGAVVGFAKVTRDLTERRIAEEALRQSEDRFRTLVESVVDYGIFMLDPDGRVASWNEGAQRIKGYRPDEIIGRHFSAFYQPEDRASGRPDRGLQIAAETGRHGEEGWRVRRDGARFWASVTITALRNAHGTLIGFAKVTRDLTERRAAEERALEDTRRVAAAEAANRTKSEFLTSMSHELRTPLNAIAGYAELLLMGVRGPVTEPQREDLERIRRSQQHLLGIINDLLNYSRLEAGRVRFTDGPVPLGELADDAVEMVAPQARAKRLTVQALSCEVPVVARGDRAKVEQIVLNLLSNAVKFTPAEGRVTLACAEAGDDVRLTVTDTGPGVPESQRQAVFEPFVQLGRSLTTGHDGTGLGLAISRDLARAMDGELTVDAAPEGGACFTLRLRRMR